MRCKEKLMPSKCESIVALTYLIERGVTWGMGPEKPGELIPLKSVPSFLWSWNKLKHSKYFWEIAMFIAFKEIIECSLDNCLSWASLMREGGNHCYESLEARWVSDGMWWGRGGFGYFGPSDCEQNERSPSLMLMSSTTMVFSFTRFPRFLSLSHKLLLDSSP